MNDIKTYPFDPAEFLADEETIVGYLSLALESDDPRLIAKALGAVAKARGGIDELTRQTGISKEELSRSLGEGGNPELGTVLKVLHALGVRLTPSLVA